MCYVGVVTTLSVFRILFSAVNNVLVLHSYVQLVLLYDYVHPSEIFCESNSVIACKLGSFYELV